VNRLIRLLQTPAVALEAFEHPADTEHRDPDREVASGFCLNFVDGGSFRVRVPVQPGAKRGAMSTWHMTPRTLFVTTPGLMYSCTHDETHPTDRCLSIAYADATVDHLLSAGAMRADAGAWALTNRQQYLRQQLDACARGDELRIDALAGDLFWSLAKSGSTPAPLFRATLLTWYATRVDRARALMEASYHEPLTLTRLSRDAGMSPFHFARVFRELQGEPPHRYLTTVRLAHAARRLREGASVTDTCFAVGFGSLSHFVTAFRRRYGVSPSKWKGMKISRGSSAIVR
jgi:AraC family transcriptional regulator